MMRLSSFFNNFSFTGPLNSNTKVFFFVITEALLIGLAFTTNFVSAFVLKNVLDFDTFKSAAVTNALRIVSIEKFFGVFIEESVQRWSISHIGGWQFWNSYYAAAHPAVAILTLVIILIRSVVWSVTRADWRRVSQYDNSYPYDPTNSAYYIDGSVEKPSIIKRLFFKRGVLSLNPLDQYRFLRTIFLLSIFISLFGYIFLPTMPPRLLNNCDFLNNNGKLLGGCFAEYTFVDTIDKHGSLFFTWKDESIQILNNPYAALPSQHALVAAYVAMVWIVLAASSSSSPSGAPITRPMFRSKLSLFFYLALNSSFLFYPALTLFCIVITANHYLFDAFLGFVILFVATLISLLLLNINNPAPSKLVEELPM
ncbi:hypothetical protein AYI68_g5426 [Smittium mucronatum]|uniref:Inositolphosphotransferase Aur1/Ipt1 domain-containing protein n=1 Tax=Smittium mucronatum TaxID=133383 RepID=A0A1R0GUB5_9FUNG|nr:hypothetical protein AYI68_g5426 [Smittium mucronatum]